ncbi:MAG: multicopper oxidase family protein [Anaerolineae bacterium]|nr:multicopper oxidase family protein [Anaerolineae bacterium]
MKHLPGRTLKIVGLTLIMILVVGGSVLYVAARRSVIPDGINMSSDMNGMDMSNIAMTTPSANSISLTALVAGESDAPVKTFTLTTQTAKIDIGNGKTVDAYTYNGTLPGSEIRVQQGDMVVVNLVNKLPVSTTIHWHGISVPNAEDGVAGLTQDAVQPGKSYTYRFIAKDVGTYWYHSHQDTLEQLPLGLYGAIIVEPKVEAVHYDHDYTVALHEWRDSGDCAQDCPEVLMMNDRIDHVSFAAKAGESIHLRIIAAGDEFHYPVLVGAPFKVIALDGHDLNAPTELNNVELPIGTAQRYDLSFVMPEHGNVTLIDGANRAVPGNQHPTAVFGDGQPNVTYPDNLPLFDFSTYGTPTADPITLDSHFNVQFSMELSSQLGFYNGHFTMTFPINNQTYPNIPSIKVNQGDLVKIHVSNNAGVGFPIPHAMHLHGHFFTVLAHNGKPLSGSPVHLDTLIVSSGESYDVAFLADNPGLWMLHCHILAHDAQGMDMMLEYPNIYTPYTIGTASGNNPF